MLLVTAEAFASGAFHANLTFAQGHVAFHPDTADPRQFGLLRGQLGSLAAGDLVLGYAMLPAGMALHQPLDVYWNDRRLSATLRPYLPFPERGLSHSGRGAPSLAGGCAPWLAWASCSRLAIGQ